MSQSYSLYCHATKQRCDAGQSSLSHPLGIRVYNVGKEAEALSEFLAKTAGHPVVLVMDDHADLHWVDYEDLSASDEG